MGKKKSQIGILASEFGTAVEGTGTGLATWNTPMLPSSAERISHNPVILP